MHFAVRNVKSHIFPIRLLAG